MLSTRGTVSAAVPLLAVCLISLSWPLPSSQHEEHKELSYKAVTLSDICFNRQVPIISVSEAKRLINELKQDPSICPNSYVQSFYELEPILDNNRNEFICGEKKFNEVAEYHFRYINPRVESYKLGDDLNHLKMDIKKRQLHEDKFDYTVQLDDYKQEIMIPIALQQFFKSWALQLSGICKRSFVANIERAMQDYNDHDWELFDLHADQKNGGNAGSNSKNKNKTGDKSRITVNPVTNATIDTSNLSFGNLVYLPKLEGELQLGDSELRDQVTRLDLRKQPQLDRFMHACKDRFKPVYGQLIMPIERLAKLGYNYQGPAIDSIRDKLDEDPLVSKWKMITVLCESMGEFELVNHEDKPIKMQKYDYLPMISDTFGDDLWIKGAEALAKEFGRMSGHDAKGLKRLLFKAGIGGRKVVAFIDPHQFAWYRRNQNTLSSTLNSMSILSNLASILSTVMPG